MRFHAALLFPVSVLERSGSEVFLEYFAEVSRIAELERCRNTGYLFRDPESACPERGALEIGSRCLLYGGILSAGPEQSERTSLQI